MHDPEPKGEQIPRREFLIGGISAAVASALLLQGCGGGGGNGAAAGQPAAAAPPPDPEEVQHADLVFDGTKWTDNAGNPVDVQARLSAAGARPLAHALRTYVYIWQPGWGWHWFYTAYDTGHPFGMFKNYQPHLNFDRYYSWNDMQADISQKTNKRTSYDGHFTVYRNGSALCAYYNVSVDKVFHDTGDKYNSCTNNGSAGWAAAVAAVILFGKSLASDLEPIFVDVLDNLPGL